MAGVDEKEVARARSRSKSVRGGATEMRMKRKSVGEWDKWTPGDSSGLDDRDRSPPRIDRAACPLGPVSA